MQYLHQYFRGRYEGHGQALYSAVAWGGGGAAGSIAAGYLWNVVGGAQVFIIAGITMLVLCAAHCLFNRDRPSRQLEASV